MEKAEQINDLREVAQERLWVLIPFGEVQNPGGFDNR